MKTSHSERKGRRILVFRIGELGDTLISLPALRAIRLHFPKAHIALLGNADSGGRHVTPPQILPGRGLIDECLSYRSADHRSSIRDRVGLLRKLRGGQYDLLVYLAPRIRPNREVRRDLLFFRLAGIPNVIGDKGFAPLPDGDGESLPTVEHETDHLLGRLAQSDIPVPLRGAAEFDLELTEGEQMVAETWLRQQVPELENKSMVAFGPGSKWPSKVWPEERYAEVGRRLIQERDIHPIVFGGAEDRELGDRLIGAWGRGANAAGALPVRPAAWALAQCRLYVGNDTGTMHLAAAMGTTCVAIMSALDWPGHWSPYGAGHKVLRRSVPCAGCLLKVCEKEAMRCLKEITVEEVLEACVDKLIAHHSSLITHQSLSYQ